jgi:bifunctional DNA-binding transcriptional regulator/antitoxin component of YhaV-PrlF toxin-antitoxin module
MNARIIQVTFEATVHKNDQRFTVPAKVARLLGLKRDDEIALIIKNKSGLPLFGGKQPMASRWEVYGSEMREHLRKGKPIIVQASNPKAH